MYTVYIKELTGMKKKIHNYTFYVYIYGEGARIEHNKYFFYIFIYPTKKNIEVKISCATVSAIV